MTFVNHLLSKGISGSTAESYHKTVLQYIVWTDTNNIQVEQSTYNEIISYVQNLKNKGLKQSSIQSSVGSLKHYYNWLISRGLRNDNPTSNIDIKGVKRRTLHHILSQAALEKIYFDYKNASTGNLSKKRNAVIVSLLVYQGLTTSEIKRLTTKDIKLREGKIFVNGGRRSNQRTLKLEAYQILDFMEYHLQTRQTILLQTKKETELFFVSIGKSYSLANVMQKLMQQLHKQNKQIESLKQIRASVITGWLKVYNLREVQYFAGHRYVSSTENYLINDLEDLKEDINKYHPIG